MIRASLLYTTPNVTFRLDSSIKDKSMIMKKKEKNKVLKYKEYSQQAVFSKMRIYYQLFM